MGIEYSFSTNKTIDATSAKQNVCPGLNCHKDSTLSCIELKLNKNKISTATYVYAWRHGPCSTVPVRQHVIVVRKISLYYLCIRRHSQQYWIYAWQLAEGISYVIWYDHAMTI